MIQTSIDTIGLYYFFILESNKEQLLDKRISQRSKQDVVSQIW